MDLDTPPFHDKVEFLHQLFDDTLADVAEGSDVIGKYLYAFAHATLLSTLENASPLTIKSPF